MDTVQVAAHYYQTVGPKVDGTMVAVRDSDDRQCNADYRRNIIQVAVGGRSMFRAFQRTVMLECDGSVCRDGR